MKVNFFKQSKINQSNWYPEIMYEEQEDGISSKIPFIMVPEKEKMPILVYIFESRETGEYEPGLSGEPVPILEMDLHQYADMAVLKNRLNSEMFDAVRIALGLDPLQTAKTKGREITENIRQNLSEKTNIST